MKLSLNWLADHVDLSGLDPGTIGRELTMKSALIEGWDDQAAALEGVVVGHVLTREQHPDADRLSVCTVDAGQGDEPAHVVCGAPNVEAGQKIVYAPVGTRLPNGLKLKKAKIRGQVSEGMICAEDEIGLGPDHDGILVLDPALEPGMPIGAVPGFTDVIFDIDNKSVTHRPDLWGHRGFARELSVIFGRELKPLDLDASLQPGDAGPAIDLEAGAGCPMYAGLCVEAGDGVTPDWMRHRLVACGLRPIHLLVDISNYVMLELGQPTHPFDRDRLAGDRIVVRRARDGESLVTLDEVERKLVADDVVIADGEQGVAIAGIMGGGDSEVGEATRRVFLESACFDAVAVRRTSSRLGLRTDALARFEKDLDPALVEEAVRRYAWWVKTLDPGAAVAGSYRVAGSARAPERQITLDPDMVTARLGVDLEPAEIRTVLERLGFVVTAGTTGLEVAVPSWRATRDVTLAEDLVEEVGRVVGYDRIPDRPPAGPFLLGALDRPLQVEEALRDVLARDEAFTEVLSYSTVRDTTLEAVGLEGGAERPRLTNALQQGAAHLRPSVVPECLARLEDWLRQGPTVRCFEVGRGYALDGGAIQERREVVAVLARRGSSDSRDLVRELVGVARSGLAELGQGEVEVVLHEPGPEEPWLHPTRSARVVGAEERTLATLGAVAPGLLQRLGLSDSAGVLVFHVDVLAAADPGARFLYEPPPRFPAARIDLAFVASYALSTGQLEEAIRKAGPKTLRQVQAFDVYRGAPLQDDERSVAFHLVFQARDRTLKDEDVQKARDKIVKAVSELGARLR